MSRIIAGLLAAPIVFAVSPVIAGPCSQDVAILDRKMSELGVKPPQEKAESSGNTGSVSAVAAPGVSSAKGVTQLPDKSAAGRATESNSGQQKVDPRAITALQEARKADLQGDAKKCADAVKTAREHLKT